MVSVNSNYLNSRIQNEHVLLLSKKNVQANEPLKELNSDEFSNQKELDQKKQVFKNECHKAFGSYLAQLDETKVVEDNQIKAVETTCIEKTIYINSQADIEEIAKHSDVTSLRLVIPSYYSFMKDGVKPLNFDCLNQLSNLKDVKLVFSDSTNIIYPNLFDWMNDSLSTLPKQVTNISLNFPPHLVHTSLNIITIDHFYKLMTTLNETLPNLHRLELSYIDLTFRHNTKNIGWVPLSKEEEELLNKLKGLFSNLEEVVLDGCIKYPVIYDVNLDHTAKLLSCFESEHLRILTLSNNDLFLRPDSPFTNLALLNCPNLEELTIIPSVMSPHKAIPASFYRNRSFPHLKVLNLSGSVHQTLDFSSLAPHLKTLILNDSNVQGCRIDDLAKYLDLETLSLQRVSFSGEQLEQMTFNPLLKLQHLDLEGSNVKSFPFDTFTPFLRHLNLSKSNVSGGDLKKLSALKDLETLDLSDTKISPSVLTHLSKLENLKELNLRKTSLRDGNFDLLTKLTHLEVLDLSETNLSLLDLQKLGHLTQLKVLKLEGLKNSNITEAHLNELRQQLPDCQIIR